MGKKNNQTENDETLLDDSVEINIKEEATEATEKEVDTKKEDVNPAIEPTESEQWKAEKDQLETQIVELKDKYLRSVAEFDNFRRRTNKERLELIKTAGADTMTALLPILDDFDRAKKTADDENTEETFSEGVALVYSKLHSILKQRGLTELETSIGTPFNVDFHEALTEIPAPNEEMKGKIVDVIEKGYKLGDKIIRYAKVVVGK